jgi:hypothetical protein
MKQQSTRLLVLLLAAPLASSLSVSATSRARLFLRAHVGTPPQADELAELRTENPEAYALVKALLTKRSLGLLDPKHPTASFAKAEQPHEDQGPEVFEKMASPEELQAMRNPQPVAAKPKVDMPYAEVQPAPAHRDWMNWKPQSAAMDDETMVQNVLGAVAQLKGSKKAGLLSNQHAADENPLVADAGALGSEQPEPTAVSPKPAAPAAPRENSYLKSIDFGLATPQAAEEQKTAAPAKHENSYLKGLDLSGDMPKVVASSEEPKKASHMQSSSNNYLASFSWDDSKPQEESNQKVSQQEPKVDPSKDSLLSWLGVVKKAPVQRAPTAPTQPANPYIMDLS